MCLNPVDAVNPAATDGYDASLLSLHPLFAATSLLQPPLRTLASVAAAALLTADKRCFLCCQLCHLPPGPTLSSSTRS
ncbi:hypothetical protein S245_052969, partial [Arachis hypogaea]